LKTTTLGEEEKEARRNSGSLKHGATVRLRPRLNLNETPVSGRGPSPRGKGGVALVFTFESIGACVDRGAGIASGERRSPFSDGKGVAKSACDF
jgi:hypothetical protein